METTEMFQSLFWWLLN